MRQLPRWVAITGWLTGLAILLFWEFVAAATTVEGDTISENVWWIIGQGEGVTWFYLPARILVFGVLGWMILHFATRKV